MPVAYQLGGSLLVLTDSSKSWREVADPPYFDDLVCEIAAIEDKQVDQSLHPLILSGKVMGGEARFLIDSGAIHRNYMDLNYALKRGFRLRELPGHVRMANRQKVPIHAELTMHVVIQTYRDLLTFVVLDLGRGKTGYDVILGMGWLAQYNPVIDWKKNAIAFTKGRYQHVLTCPNLKSLDPQAEIVSPVQMWELIEEGCVPYLASIDFVPQHDDDDDAMHEKTADARTGILDQAVTGHEIPDEGFRQQLKLIVEQGRVCPFTRWTPSI